MPLLRMEVSFQKNEAKLLVLQVRLTFNNVFFFITEEISNLMTF